MIDEAAYTENQKLLRVSQVDEMELPESYRRANPKEKLMLEYVYKFERQFIDLYPKRLPLMLCPRNECGERKFICTTLRPTQLPFAELYDYESCARFVADFVAYEPLDLQASLPSHVPSPSTLLEWQAGDCFDMAQLLASLLLGVGYDAYVVSGYAPRAVTQADQSTNPMVIKQQASHAQEEAPSPSKFAVPPRRVLESNFLKQKAAKAKADEATSKAATASPDEQPVDQEAEEEQLDDLRGKRVHAWVLLLSGKRMLEESLFVEPSTGMSYSLDGSPYYGIESVWNASNYWVSMQGNLPPSKMGYDLTATSKWENVLLDFNALVPEADDDDEANPVGGLSESSKGLLESSSKQEEEVAPPAESEIEKVLVEMPPSWVTKLALDRERFSSRCPLSHKATVFHKALVEKYCEYSREDGLTERVTLFSGAEMTDGGILESRETFVNRKDKLSRRVIKRSDSEYDGKPSTTDTFEPGRPKALKKLVHVEGLRREFYFYGTARLDGLQSRIEVFGVSTEHHYSGEREPLVYRSATYGSKGKDGNEAIREMKERFKRSPEVDAEADTRERTFSIAPNPVDNKIEVIYHYGHDRVTASWRTYSKAGHTNVQVNPFSHDPTEQQMIDDFQRLQQAERDCLNMLRESDRQAKEMMKKREEEEEEIQAEMETYNEEEAGRAAPHIPAHLAVSCYDTQRNRLAVRQETTDEKEQVPRDYLTAFLPRAMSKEDKPLKREEALAARDACLKSLKDRLVERANIVQSRLDEENAALNKRQATFQRNRDHMEPADEAEYERYCQEAMFRIQILEQRLDRHTEISLQQYSEMDARLRADPRLVALGGGVL